jgi:hypothetical protein
MNPSCASCHISQPNIPQLLQALIANLDASFVQDLEDPNLDGIINKIRYNHGRHRYFGALNSIIAMGVAPVDAPSFQGKRAMASRLDRINDSGVAHADAASFLGRRANDSRRKSTWECKTDNCKNRVSAPGGLCQPCHMAAPKVEKAEFCVGINGGRCGSTLFSGNHCRKCYYHWDEKKRRAAKKAEAPKCGVEGCNFMEHRGYGLCIKHYKDSIKNAKISHNDDDNDDNDIVVDLMGDVNDDNDGVATSVLAAAAGAMKKRKVIELAGNDNKENFTGQGRRSSNRACQQPNYFAGNGDGADKDKEEDKDEDKDEGNNEDEDDDVDDDE